MGQHNGPDQHRSTAQNPTAKNQNLIFRPRLTKPLKNHAATATIFTLWDGCGNFSYGTPRVG
jgi:hypothetical protein